jgi:hypothetical protein
MASSLTPVSGQNVPTIIGVEAVPGVVATVGKWIAYDQNTLVPNQTMEKNTENRGNAQMGTRVPGMKNPGGTLAGHQTDKTLPQSWYAALGAITAGDIVPQPGPVATLRVLAGLITNGTHSYKYVVTDAAAGTKESAVSNTVTTDTTTHGQVTVARPGVLPVGWTWALYRSAAGNAVTGPWVEVPGASALAYNVVSFVDDVADGSLSGTWPVSFTADDNIHVITPGLILPAHSIQVGLPYLGDAEEFYVALGAYVNKAVIKVSGASYYDAALDYLYFDDNGPNVSSFDVAPLDWRGGEKIHHAMALAADVLLDDVACAKFIDFTLTVSNNLDTSDHPVGGRGGLGSLARGQQEIQVAATIKVTDPAVLLLARDTSTLHKLSFKHTFATGSHYAKTDVFGIGFDPTRPGVSGAGILKMSTNGFASQPDGGNQIVTTINNGVPTATYTT